MGNPEGIQLAKRSLHPTRVTSSVTILEEGLPFASGSTAKHQLRDCKGSSLIRSRDGIQGISDSSTVACTSRRWWDNSRGKHRIESGDAFRGQRTPASLQLPDKLAPPASSTVELGDGSAPSCPRHLPARRGLHRLGARASPFRSRQFATSYTGWTKTC